MLSSGGPSGWGVAGGWSTLEGVVAAGLVFMIAATLLHYLVEVPGGRWVRLF